MENNEVLFFEANSAELLELMSSIEIQKLDLLEEMLDELTLNKKPQLKSKSDPAFLQERYELVKEKVSRINGIWVYYPWRNVIVRMLDEDDFIFLRTVRNHDKITESEQLTLKEKVVGIVGLSVGFAVLMSVALERVAGTIRIADFDSLDLSNLNRIFHTVFDISENKAVIAKRRILELDPYLKIEIFTEGLTQSNVGIFFDNGTSKLDAIVDECDDGLVKLMIRENAKKHHVPVIMETSDRSILDIERYDLDFNYPYLHGMLEGINKDVSTSRDILMCCIDFSKISERGKLSMSKVGIELRSWPQLASDVIIGGGSACAALRKIFLGQSMCSQRIYFDLESQIS